jgi:uncharacterized protein YndB with AHSA1/START domain
VNRDRTNKSSARALVDIAAGSVLATVEIAATAERVFKALSDPKELVRWWGSPDTYRAHRWEADFRVGGQWRVDGKSAEGAPYSVYGEFAEITPPRRLVQSWTYDWEKDQPPTRLTYILDDIPGGTRVTVRHEGFASQEGCASHGSGWERVLGWLEGFLEARAIPGL